jgi:hypothetical protein
MPLAGFEPMIPVFKRAKTLHALGLFNITRFAPRGSNREVVFTIDGSLSVHIQPLGHKRGVPNRAVDVSQLAVRHTARLRYHELKCRRSVARAVRPRKHV